MAQEKTKIQGKTKIIYILAQGAGQNLSKVSKIWLKGRAKERPGKKKDGQIMASKVVQTNQYSTSRLSLTILPL